MITLEDIERRQRMLVILFRIFVVILIVIVCVLAAWLVTYFGYSEEFGMRRESQIRVEPYRAVSQQCFALVNMHAMRFHHGAARFAPRDS